MASFLIVAAALLIAPSPQAAREHHHLAEISLRDAASLRAVQQIGVPLDCQARSNDVAEITVTDDELAELTRRGANVRVTQRDLEDFYAARLARTRRRSSPPPGSGIDWAGGSMGGYFTFVEMEALLDQISALNPAICTAKFSLGLSVEAASGPPTSRSV